MPRYLVVEPPSRHFKKEDVVVIDTHDHPVNVLQIWPHLTTESLSWEDLDNKGIAECPDPGTEKGREEATQRIHEENGETWCELLNYVLAATGKEVSTECTVHLTDNLPDDYLDDDDLFDDWEDDEEFDDEEDDDFV